jgi:hypothetical protein
MFVDYSDSRSVRTIDEHVRAEFILEPLYLQFRGREPLQCGGHVGRPNPPSGAIAELHDIAGVMPRDSKGHE